MAKISIQKSSISQKANNILQNVDDLNSLVMQLDNVIGSINIAWEGADELKYVNSMREKYIKETKELIEQIRTYGEYLQNVPGAYSLLDETFANKNIDV